VACGFDDQAHLTDEWRRLAGCTPGAWLADEAPQLAAELSGAAAPFWRFCLFGGVVSGETSGRRPGMSGSLDECCGWPEPGCSTRGTTPRYGPHSPRIRSSAAW